MVITIPRALFLHQFCFCVQVDAQVHSCGDVSVHLCNCTLFSGNKIIDKFLSICCWYALHKKIKLCSWIWENTRWNCCFTTLKFCQADFAASLSEPYRRSAYLFILKGENMAETLVIEQNLSSESFTLELKRGQFLQIQIWYLLHKNR